jgi:hypothetical protein
VIDLLPGGIRQEGFNCPRDLCGARPQILLKHCAVLIDHEGNDAGIAIFGGVGDEAETADHLAID